MNAKITKGITAIFLTFLCLNMAQSAEKKGEKTMQKVNAQNTGETQTSARVINVEFNFTPFVGDPSKAEKVETVQGKVRLFLNNVLINEQDVHKEKVPVMFEAREIAPAVWVSVSSLGSVVHKGKNKFRVEFEPADPNAAYQARLSWTQVMDQAKVVSSPGVYKATNQSGEGKETKKGKGEIIMEKEFTADW